MPSNYEKPAARDWLLVDLLSSTAISSLLGSSRMTSFLEDLNKVLRKTFQRHGGSGKQENDSWAFHFPSSQDCYKAGRSLLALSEYIHQDFEDYGLGILPIEFKMCMYSD